MKYLSIAAITALFNCAVPQNAMAADIRVSSIPGVKAALVQLLPRFEAETGHRVAIVYEIYAGQKQRLDAGEFDVAIFADTHIQELVAQTKVDPKSTAKLARTSIGVAVRKGAPKPDIASEAAFKRTLLAAKSIAFTKESSTGQHVYRLLQRLGIADEVLAKSKPQPGGNMTTPAVAAGEVELAIVLISDIVAHPGVDLVGPLPPGLQNEVVQVAGVGTTARDADAAATLIRFLASPIARPVFKATGLEPAGP